MPRDSEVMLPVLFVNGVLGKIASEKEEKTEENAADTEEKAAEVSEQNA